MPTLRTTEGNRLITTKLLGITRPDRRKKEQAAIQEAKSKKKMEKYYNSKTREQAIKRAKWSTAAMKQVMPRTEANSDPNGRDHTKLKNHSERGLTS
ncbi:hypothetical protein Tco_0441156 [Tanacetum coccineum]